MTAVYSPEDVAEKLSITPRMAMKLGRQHAACSIFGRKFRFTDADIETLLQATRAEPLSKRAPVKPALSGWQLEQSLRRLTKKKGQEK